jgi:trk system potassium uptake protein
VHVVIMGCGRVGSTLAHSLEDLGHTVAIIDQDPGAFRRLSPHFAGRRVTGAGFDRDTLAEAGIGGARACGAGSRGDNSNLFAARVARENFGVENVCARIYDPRRAEIYQRLGIPTVATVRWTADQMLRRLLPTGSSELWRDPSGQLALVEVHTTPGWMGHRVAKLEDATGFRVAYVTRLGDAVVPGSDTVLQDGDLVHVMLNAADVARAEEAFAKGPSA